jgi:hypothetical protein
MSQKTISAPSAGYFIVYYDEPSKCIGGLANNPDCEWNYTGRFSGRDVMWIPQNFNPVGLTYKELKAIKDKHQAEQYKR